MPPVGDTYVDDRLRVQAVVAGVAFTSVTPPSTRAKLTSADVTAPHINSDIDARALPSPPDPPSPIDPPSPTSVGPALASAKSQQIPETSSQAPPTSRSVPPSIAEVTAFFLNVYNSLTVHAILLKPGGPQTLWQRWKFFNDSAYVIAGRRYSLQVVSNSAGALRSVGVRNGRKDKREIFTFNSGI